MAEPYFDPEAEEAVEIEIPEKPEDPAQDYDPEGPLPEDRKSAEAEGQRTRVLTSLLSMYTEAKESREGGDRPRDKTWRQNWDDYWGRVDWSDKAEWQSKQWLPEVPNMVERFSAAMEMTFANVSRDSLVVEDPMDKAGGALLGFAKDLAWICLERSGTTATGQPIGFQQSFADTVKAGCMQGMALAVTFQDGRVRVGPVDCRELYLDPTGRGRYRIRQYEIDFDDLWSMALKDNESLGDNLWDLEAIAKLQPSANEEQRSEEQRSSGGTREVSRERKPITLYEYLYNGYDDQGRFTGKKLCTIANQLEVVRGPEPNPFWHGLDWIVYSPLIRVPFSVYGKTYVENFGALATTFIEILNLLLDATQASAMNAFIGWPGAMEDPGQLDEGVHPNKIFYGSMDIEQPGKPFLESLQLGTLPAGSIDLFRMLQSMLNEAASQSEIAMGQLAPKSDTTASEVVASQTSQTQLINSIAKGIEVLVDAVFYLVYATAVQHFNPQEDPDLAKQIGPEWTAALVAQRQGFRERRFHFKFTGISGAIERGRRLRGLLALLNIVSGNPILAQAFMQRYSIERLVEELLEDFGIDPRKLTKTQTERLADAAKQAAQRMRGEEYGIAQAMAGRQRAAGGASGQSGGAALSEGDPGGAFANMEAPL